MSTKRDTKPKRKAKSISDADAPAPSKAKKPQKKLTKAQREARRQAQQRYTESKRGGPARTPKPCGTYAAYRRHLRKKEQPCADCTKANTEYLADLKAKKEGDTE